MVKSTLAVKPRKILKKLCILYFLSLSLKLHFLSETRREKLQGCKQTRTRGKKTKPHNRKTQNTNKPLPTKKPSTCTTKRDEKDLEKYADTIDSDRKGHKRRGGEEKMSILCRDSKPSYKGIVTKDVVMITQHSD